MKKFPVDRAPRDVCAPFGAAVLAAIAVVCFAPGICQAEKQDQAKSEKTPAKKVPDKVDFRKHVVPILEKHCFRCHTATERNGGLRLDWRPDALQGGDSGKPVFGGTVETNEILRRVTSKDEAVRMPLGGQPLNDMEIATIRRWVEQGADWPAKEVPKAEPPEEADKSFIDRALDFYLNLEQVFRAMLAAIVGILLFAFLMERAKARKRKGKIAERGWWAAFVRGVAAVPRLVPYSLTVALALIFCGLLLYEELDSLRKKNQELEASVKSLQKDVVSQVGSATTLPADAGPPLPTGHTDWALQRTYYRGNCERNSKLYNNGKYCTAVFRIALTNRDGKPLQVGDRVPDDGCFLKYDLDRAPGASGELFTKKLIDTVFLSTHAYSSAGSPRKDNPVKLTTVKPDWQWTALVPLSPKQANPKKKLKEGAKPKKAGSKEKTSRSKDRAASRVLAGYVYIYYQGKITEKTVKGACHYSMRYSIVIIDGRIAEGSDIWMGARFWPTKVSLKEWFDHNPMPIIKGENTKDPELIGTPEHLGKKKSKPK